MAEAPEDDAVASLVDQLDRKIDRSGACAMITEADGLRGYHIVGTKRGRFVTVTKSLVQWYYAP